MPCFKEKEANVYVVNDQQTSGSGGEANIAFKMENLEPGQVGSSASVNINRVFSEPTSGIPAGCFVRRSVIVTLVVIAVVMVGFMGLIMAMYGPGNKQLKYYRQPLREIPGGSDPGIEDVSTPPPCKPATSTTTEGRPTKGSTIATEAPQATTLGTSTNSPTNGTKTALTKVSTAGTEAATETTTATSTKTPTAGMTTASETESTGLTHSTAITTVIPTTEASENKCDVVVLGGGIAGLYTAEYLLRHKNSTNETSVCVLERESRLGGRIYDVQFDTAPNITAGLGAWKFAETGNEQIMKLFERFFTKSSTVYLDSGESIVESRGFVSNKSEDLKEKEIKINVYPRLSKSRFQNMSIQEMFYFALESSRTKNVADFATIETYLSNTLSVEAEEFLSDIQGLNRHYDRQVSAKSYVEYSKLPQYNSREFSKPVKGMGKLIKALEKSIVSSGGKIYTNSDVKQIDDESENNFVLKTAVKQTFRAKKVVIAAPPKVFETVQGNIAERIRATDEFQSIKPVQAFKGAAVYSSAWWENTSFPLLTYQEYISNSDCLGMTFPYEHTNGAAVLNVMYTTGFCAQKWANIYQSAPSLFHKEIHRALVNKFRSSLSNPRALESKYQYWSDGAWYFQKPGSNITMAAVETWAKRPLPGKDLFLVGSAYHSLRGWCEGAILSSQNALREGWKILHFDPTKIPIP